MKRVKLLSVLVILGVLAACGPSAPASGEVVADKVEDMVGIWACSATAEGWYVQFRADGTLRVADKIERLEYSPWFVGEFWFEGTVFNETDTACDDKGTYEVRLVREGGETDALSWKVIEDDCPARVSCYGELTPIAGGE
jgi:hypothetical protein